MREPVAIQSVLDSFSELWSPRIVAKFNDYDMRVAKFHGEYIWHVHDNTDELFLVVDGELTIWLRSDGVERSVTLPKGSVFVVPRGMEHKPVAAEPASIMMLEPTGTVTTGDRNEGVRADVPTHTGYTLA